MKFHIHMVVLKLRRPFLYDISYTIVLFAPFPLILYEISYTFGRPQAMPPVSVVFKLRRPNYHLKNSSAAKQ
ncbi:hypothetical protein [Paenibacillus sp. IITD108]|uniref:hypothetical protein n=1 Tax=Paenibacillus sp. IITD108 TaxID=3116649 RepID=UPI002F415482